MSQETEAIEIASRLLHVRRIIIKAYEETYVSGSKEFIGPSLLELQSLKMTEKLLTRELDALVRGPWHELGSLTPSGEIVYIREVKGESGL